MGSILEKDPELTHSQSDDQGRAEQVRRQSSGERTLGDLLGEFLERYGGWVAAAILVLVAASAYVSGHRKPLWYDEVFSVIVAMQPDWPTMLKAMPPDGNPPLYALVTRALIHVFGEGDFVDRLPSLLGFLAALTGVYVYVRRECGAVFGLLAMVLLFFQPGWTYSFEARPYALLLAWMMLALVCWQSATDRTSGRGLALAGMAVAIAAGVLTHNLGIVVVGLPLMAGEGTRIWKTRRVDWPVLATGLAALPAIAVTLQTIRRVNALLLGYQHNYLHPLTWAKFHQYGIEFPLQSLPAIVQFRLLGWMLALIVLTWPVFWLRRDRVPNDVPGQTRVRAHILAAAIMCAALLPVTWAMMMATTGYYLCRYGIGTIAGLAMVTSLLMYRSESRRSLVAMAAGFFMLIEFGFVIYFKHLEHPIKPRDRLVYGYRTDLPIVVNDTYRYLPMWWYAPSDVRSRLFYLKDEATAVRNGYVIVEVAMVSEAPYLPMPIAQFDQFLATHDHFLLDFTGTVNLDIKDRLKAAGFEVKYVTNDEVDNTLFDVKRVRPAGSGL